jgi:SPP1 family predicted phage head-tail adaptor
MGRSNKIVIQRKTTTYNEYNEPIDSWSDLGWFWAKVTTTGGGAFYAAQKLNETMSCLFTVRYTSLIDVMDRVVFGGKTFEILALNDVDARHADLQITAKEIV